jgi:hypothetical protein
MSASRKPILVRLIGAIARLLSTNWRHTLEAPVVSEAAPKGAKKTCSPSTLSIRLANVQQRYAPLARAPIKGGSARRKEGRRPVVKAQPVKKAKLTTLPTTVAVKNLALRSAQSATVIHFPTSGPREQLLYIGRAA